MFWTQAPSLTSGPPFIWKFVTWQSLPECGSFSSVNHFHFSLINSKFSEILTLPGFSISFRHCILLIGTWTHSQFHVIFLDFPTISWPFRQIGRIVNKHVLGVHFAGRWDCGPEAIRRPPSSLPFGHSASAQQCKHCDTATAATQSAKIVTNACEIDYHQKIMRNAKNTNYLTLTTIWQRLAGNLTILPRSSR